MTWKRNVLVVANVTATSDDLLEALRARAQRAPASFTLVIPATPFGGGRQAAGATLTDAIERLREAGLEADGRVGASDPIVAVTDNWDPKRFDEIIVSTLPMKFSKWLHAGLPERIAKVTDATVTHVVAQPQKAAVETVTLQAHSSDPGVLRPLSVLSWGGQKEH